VTWISLAFLNIIGVSPAMGNFFSQARDDRTIKSMFRPSRPTNSSNKLSSPSEAIVPSRNKTLVKTPKAAKHYNISRPTRPDYPHLSEKCAAEPAEVESVSIYELCFPGLEKEPPKVNYGRKPTLQPQGAHAQATNPLMRTRPEQPLTPPPTPPWAVLAPHFPLAHRMRSSPRPWPCLCQAIRDTSRSIWENHSCPNRLGVRWMPKGKRLC